MTWANLTNMSLEMDLRRWFKKCRREKKLSRHALAEQIGSSEATIERFENGRGMMSMVTIEDGLRHMGYEIIISMRLIDKE